MFKFLLLLTIFSIAYASNTKPQPGNRKPSPSKKLYNNVWLRPGQKYQFSFDPPKQVRKVDQQWDIASCVDMQLTCTPGKKVKDVCQTGLQIRSNKPNFHPACKGGKFSQKFLRTEKIKLTLKNDDSRRLGQFTCIAQTVGDYKCDCGKAKQPKAGTPVTTKNYPMMAGLRYTNHAEPYCGATIINFKQVLTLAECVEQIDVKRQNVHVITGLGTRPQGYAIANFKKHEFYDRDYNIYNIALVTVKDSIKFDDNASPVCLPFINPHFADHNDMNYHNDKADILGFYPKDFEARKPQIRVWKMENCAHASSPINNYFYCSKKTAKDSCTVNFGGPALIPHKLSVSPRQLLVGIVNACQTVDDKIYSLMTDVGEHTAWIEKNSPRGVCYCKG